MKRIAINITSNLGLDCGYCSHELDEDSSIGLEDKDVEKLQSILNEIENEGEDPTKEQIEKKDKALAEEMDAKIRSEFYDLMVVRGWNEYGWQVCGNDSLSLMEEDMENGTFVFERPDDIEEDDEDDYEDACMEAWEEKETEKMDAMDLNELADYLEERYGLDTDISCMDCDWSVIEIIK